MKYLKTYELFGIRRVDGNALWSERDIDMLEKIGLARDPTNPNSKFISYDHQPFYYYPKATNIKSISISYYYTMGAGISGPSNMFYGVLIEYNSGKKKNKFFGKYSAVTNIKIVDKNVEINNTAMGEATKPPITGFNSSSI